MFENATTEIDDLSPEHLATEHCLIHGANELHPDLYPELDSISPRFFYRFLSIPDEAADRPEYIFVRRPDEDGLNRADYWRYHNFLFLWNNTWEAGCARRGLFKKEVPKELRWVTKQNADLRFVWRAATHSYDPYAALYHLLSRSTLERFGLPLLRRGLWPQLSAQHLLGHILPADFDERLEQALTYHLWPLLGARGGPSRFSRADPIRILSHNLDYWMPYIDIVAQRRNRNFSRTRFEDEKDEADYYAHRDEMPPGVSLQTPLCGGALWMGEIDALSATKEMIEVADERGNLRAILDSIRSHRIEDDFSERWSFEREDFERKLYSKRNKVKVTFVELDHTTPVHGPNSEAHENLLWEDFLTLLEPKERRVVVCLRNAETRLGNIAKLLGYANHSAISKHLAKIRRNAKKFFETE